MHIAIVILNWNGEALLERFLPSVVRYSPKGSVYVADNASTDDSISFVESHYPEVKIIKNTENGGYAKGYNDALSQIDAPIYCLLNSDVEVTPNWLIPIQESFDKDQKVAAMQPKILDCKRKEYFEYAGAAGGFIDQFGYPFCRARIFNTLEKDQGQYNDVIPVFWATGACLFVKKDVFEETGGFDSDFFAHQEEVDLCWRIQNLGYKVLYDGRSTIYHLGGATLSSMNPKKTFLNFRNSLLMLVKNVPTMRLWFLIATRLILDAIAGLKFLIEGKSKHTWAIVKAHGSFYKKLPLFLRKRKNNTTRLKYYIVHLVVWQYFILRRKFFGQLKKVN